MNRAVLLTKFCLLLSCMGIVLFSGQSSLLAAKEPEWVQTRGKCAQYPAGRYYTGFGCSEDEDLEKAVAVAESSARKDLAAFFQTHICSVLESQKSLSGSDFSQYLKANITATSRLQLLGVSVEVYQNRRQNEACALAVMEIEGARRVYTEKSERIRSEIRSRLGLAREAEGSGKAQEAVQNFLATYPLFAEIEEVDAVLLVLGTGGPHGASGQPTPDEKLSRAAVAAAVDRLLGQPCSTVDDLAAVMAYRLAPQIGARAVTVAPFTYQDTEFTSEFSRYLGDSLRNKLGVHKVSATAAEGVRMRSLDPQPAAGSPTPTPVVTGSYVEKGAEIRVFALVSDPASGERFGAADSAIRVAAVEKEGLALRPENFTQAMADQKVFSKDEIVGCGLGIQAWTSKGDRNLAFRNGEKYRVYIRLSQPAHIRILYHLATGQRVLVPILGEEQYFVDTSKVNKVVELPETYVAVPPFGVEVLQVFASTRPFPSIPTETQVVQGETYKVVRVNSDKELGTVVAKLRGIRIDAPEGEAEPLVAEARVTLTTMK